MTLLTNVVDGLAGVHALVIGVGKYPHLEGGTEQTFEDSQGMGQLGSPPKSAAAMVNWLMQEHSITDRPLKSLEVLTSELVRCVDDQGTLVMSEPANFPRVRAAIRAWKARGSSSRDNVLIFYFCGHGVSTGAESSLLLENFGDDADDPFTAAIDATKLLTGMRKCPASRQVYLIDACRTVQEDYLKEYANSGAAVVDATAHANLGAVQQAVIWSTSLGAQAFGNAQTPSLFANAILLALRGAAGGQDFNGDWVVRPLSLKDALDVVMPRIAPNVEQVVSIDHVSINFPFHHYTSPPKVPAWVRCDPAGFLARTHLICSSSAGEVASRLAPVDERWELELLPGEYEFQAMVPPGVEPVGREKALLYPPGKSIAIRCA